MKKPRTSDVLFLLFAFLDSSVRKLQVHPIAEVP